MPVETIILKLNDKINLKFISDRLNSLRANVNISNDYLTSKYTTKEINMEYNSIKNDLYESINEIIDENTLKIFEIVIELSRDNKWVSITNLHNNISHIADIDIGKNIGAVLQMDQANADKNIAQAKAEERRAMAVAFEQEMKAKAQEARAKVIEAEVQVPLAMAEAFKSGNLGIMDYYRMKNIDADTQMRDSIAKPPDKPGQGKK